MEKIAVLMSTYNGEKYIREQIDSILAQENIDIQLFIRDDGSSDHTVEIVRGYTADHQNIFLINQHSDGNLGAAHSFLHLIAYALKKEPDVKYFSFADQDDYWMPDKLVCAVEQIKSGKQSEFPHLYYSNKTIVDENLKWLRDEHIKFYNDFYEGFSRSYAFGCTMVFDHQMAELAVSHMPVYENWFHDSWIYRLAKSVGGEIIFDEKSHIFYRQHGNNVVGAISEKSSVHWWRIFTKREHITQKFYTEISDYYSGQLSEEGKRYIKLLLTYTENIHSAFLLAFDPQTKKRGWKWRILWILKIIFHVV